MRSAVSLLVMAFMAAGIEPAASAQEAPKIEKDGVTERTESKDGADPVTEHVLVTGKRYPDVEAQIDDTRQNYPGSVATVTSDELDLQKTHNLGDILARIPGLVYVDEDGRGTKPDIGIRGLNPIRSEYTQILHDGVPTQPSMYSEQAAYYGVPAERVAGIEVYKGGAAIRFGPNTVGGVVNYIARSPSPEPLSTVLDTRYDGNGDYLGNLFISGTRNEIAFGLEYMRKAGEGFGQSRDYHLDDVEVTVSRVFGDDSVRVHVQYYDEVSQTPGGLLPAQFAVDNTLSNKPNDFFYGKRKEADFRSRHQVADNQQIETLLYAYSFERNWFLQDYVENGTTNLALAGSNGQFLRRFDVYGVEPTYRLTYNAGGWAGNTLTVGARLYHDRVDRRSQTGNRGTSREDDAVLTAREALETSVVAVYAENEFKPTDRLSIVPGIRYEHIEQAHTDVFAGEPEQTSDYEIAVPALGLKYAFATDMLAYVNASKSFRPPTFGNSFNPTVVATGFDLKASTAWTYEAGVRINPHPWLLLDMGVFSTEFSDQVVVSAGTAANFDTESRGIEGTARIGLSGLSRALQGDSGYGGDQEVFLLAGVTRVESTFVNGQFAGNDLPYAPHRALTFGVQYTYDQRFDLLLQGRRVGRQFTDNANTVTENAIGTVGQLDAYTVVDAKARWRVSDALSLHAGVNNINDEIYATQRRTGSQKGLFAGPRRTAYLSMTYEF